MENKDVVWAIVIIGIVLLLISIVPRVFNYPFSIISLECNIASDCPVPIKNSCPNYLRGCTANTCVYDDTISNAIVCKNEVATLAMQSQNLGSEIIDFDKEYTFTFTNTYLKPSFKLGDVSFSATRPTYSCEVPTDADFLYSPNPSPSCWSTMVSFGSTFSMKDSQTIAIDKIKINYIASAKLTRGTYNRPEDWQNIFTFSISNASSISVSDGSFIEHNIPKQLNLVLINNLPSGTYLIKVMQKVNTINLNLPDRLFEMKMLKGSNAIPISINTSNLGMNTITIQAFYKIIADNQIMIPTDHVIVAYNVVEQVPSFNPPIVVQEPSVSSPPSASTTESSNNFLKIIGIILVVLFIFRIIFR